MRFSDELVDELNLLTRFSLNSMQEGIKVHATADPAMVAAAKRLFDKGIVTQADGGYLTDLGLELAELADKVLGILVNGPTARLH